MSDSFSSQPAASDAVLIGRFKQISRWCGAAAVTFSVVALVAWGWYPSVFAALGGRWLMRMNSVVCVGACGLTLLLRGDRRDDWRTWLTHGLLLSAGLISGLMLLEYATGTSLGIDGLFGVEVLPSRFPGRMAPQSALAVLLIVIGLLTTHRRQGAASHVCDGTIIAMMVLLHAVISGYVFHDSSLNGIGGGGRMAPPSIVAHIILLVGLTCARADAGLARILTGDGSGSAVIRWLLPAVVFIPLLVSLLRIWGEGAGLLAFAGLFSALQNVLRIAIIVGMGYLLNRSEVLRKTEEARREEAERMVAMCAWTQRVRWNGEWVPVDEFLRERFGLEITHGISDEALADELDSVEAARLAKQQAA